jgi:hypothetical protein
MRRRTFPGGGAVPPPELLNYVGWCASRGLAPFAIADDRASLRAASAQWEAWEAEREVWAAAHGCVADDLPMDGDESAPFDPDSI